MWAVENLTPFAAERSWARDKNGAHEWLVAVKGTFDILPDGKVEIAETQAPPVLVPKYNGEDGASSLRYDADVVPLKPTTDVVVNGTAYAPQGRPSVEFLASIRVGDFRKIIKVVGNRKWLRGLLGPTASPFEPVTKVPILYERAYGGFDQLDPDPRRQRMDVRNPVGCGLIQREGSSLPNFEYPSGAVHKAGPAGLGALAGHWSPRRELQGTYDENWKKSRFPLLPTDWDPRSLQCAPADQRPAQHLRGGEPVELDFLTPGGKLSFSLPKVHLRFQTQIARRREEHQGQLATVIVEPDVRRVMLVWQTSLTVGTNDVDHLVETIVSEKARLA